MQLRESVPAFPCTKGNVNMLKKEGSAYLPDAFTDLSPMVNKNEVPPSVVRQVFAIPGIRLHGRRQRCRR